MGCSSRCLASRDRIKEATPAQRKLLAVGASLARFAKQVIEDGDELAPSCTLW